MIGGFDLDWWDDYEGEKSICINNYNNDVKIQYLLKLLDGYKQRLPTRFYKRGFLYAGWTKVIITTNLTKDEFHENDKSEQRIKLFNRIDRWVTFPR